MKIFLNPFYRLFTSAISYADEPGGGAGAPPATPPSNPTTYTQADVDRIAAERVAAATRVRSGGKEQCKADANPVPAI